MTNLDIHSGGGGSRNRQHYDDDIVIEPKTGGRGDLDVACHGVRREEEDARKVTIIYNRDKEGRLQAQKSGRESIEDRLRTDLMLIKERAKLENDRRHDRERIRKIQAGWKVRQRRSCKHPEIEEDLTSGFSSDFWRLPNHSRQEPWNPLSLYEGETPPITNSDPFHKISNENRQGHSNYYSTAANNNRYFANTREPEIDLSSWTTRNSIRNSIPLRQGSFSPNSPTTSVLPPYGALVQDTSIIKQASQPQPPLGISVGERTQRFSAKEEQEDIKLVQEMRECKIERESDVRVSSLNQTVPNVILEGNNPLRSVSI